MGVAVMVGRRVKGNVRFTARLPVLLSQVERRERVSRAVWLNLHPDSRDCYTDMVGEAYQNRSRTVYQQIVKVLPYPNPYVAALHKKLKGQRVKYTTSTVMVDGVEFIEFNTLTI